MEQTTMTSKIVESKPAIHKWPSCLLLFLSNVSIVYCPIRTLYHKVCFDTVLFEKGIILKCWHRTSTQIYIWGVNIWLVGLDETEVEFLLDLFNITPGHNCRFSFAS